MRPYEGYDPRMGSLEKKLCILAIRDAAKDLVGGECNDFQIIFCASAVNRVTGAYATLEDLSDADLRSLYKWVITEERSPVYGD